MGKDIGIDNITNEVYKVLTRAMNKMAKGKADTIELNMSDLSSFSKVLKPGTIITDTSDDCIWLVIYSDDDMFNCVTVDSERVYQRTYELNGDGYELRGEANTSLTNLTRYISVSNFETLSSVFIDTNLTIGRLCYNNLGFGIVCQVTSTDKAIYFIDYKGQHVIRYHKTGDTWAFVSDTITGSFIDTNYTPVDTDPILEGCKINGTGYRIGGGKKLYNHIITGTFSNVAIMFNVINTSSTPYTHATLLTSFKNCDVIVGSGKCYGINRPLYGVSAKSATASGLSFLYYDGTNLVSLDANSTTISDTVTEL